jgi:hypothetical protein
MFRGSRAPWGRSEDRCDGAGSEADGTKPPVKPGHQMPVLGVLVFRNGSALVELPSSGLRIEEMRRSPGCFCPAYLIDVFGYPIRPAIHTGSPLRRLILPKRSAADTFGALGRRAGALTGAATLGRAMHSVTVR